MAEREPECDEILRAVESYLDGEVEAPAAAEIEGHLKDCHPCMDRADFRRHLKALVHDKCAESDLPPGLADRLREALRSPEAGAASDV
jgi:mycothiol system anti-sigma-R factor